MSGGRVELSITNPDGTWKFVPIRQGLHPADFEKNLEVAFAIVKDAYMKAYMANN